jgi:hypothetical protein
MQIRRAAPDWDVGSHRGCPEANARYVLGRINLFYARAPTRVRTPSATTTIAAVYADRSYRQFVGDPAADQHGRDVRQHHAKRRADDDRRRQDSDSR